MPETLSLEDLGMSAYRVYGHALGSTPMPWEHLSLTEQAHWFHLANRAEQVLTRMEGQAMQSVAGELARLHAGEGVPEASPRAVIAWEAVARHLWALFDSDEALEKLASLEASWAEWAEKKRISLILRNET